MNACRNQTKNLSHLVNTLCWHKRLYRLKTWKWDFCHNISCYCNRNYSYCCILQSANIHVYIYKYMRNIINTMTNFNERTNALFYKNIISHTLFLKGWCWLCVRDELETGTDGHIDPKFFFDHSSTSLSSWLGCSTVGHWGPQSPQSASWFSRWHHISNWLQVTRTAPGTWLYYCLTSTCFHCSSVYLHRCISWLMARS